VRVCVIALQAWGAIQATGGGRQLCRRMGLVQQASTGGIQASNRGCWVGFLQQMRVLTAQDGAGARSVGWCCWCSLWCGWLRPEP